jgi:hypothetical protein
MSIVSSVIIFGIFLYGLFSLGKLTYIKSAPLRQRAVNHKPLHEAIEVDDLDRQLQDQEHELWPDKKFEHRNCTICGPGPLFRGLVPSRYQHPLFYKKAERISDGYGSWTVERLVAATSDNAEMVGSQMIVDGRYTGTHTLMLDLDYQVTLVQSTTAGHHHLYADVPMTWKQYKGVLKAMAAAGLIEQGYYRAALRQGFTALRPPWVEKPEYLKHKETRALNNNRKSSGKRWDHRWTKGNK